MERGSIADAAPTAAPASTAAPAPTTEAGSAETPDPIARWTAVELADLLRRRELSAIEAIDAILARVERVAPALNPFSVRLDERARAAAAATPTRSWPEARAVR